MLELTNSNVSVIRKYLKGSRLSLFNESVDKINDSLRLNGWLPGYSRSYSKGLKGVGLSISYEKNLMVGEYTSVNTARGKLNGLLKEGFLHLGSSEIELAISDLNEKELKKTPSELIWAYFNLLKEVKVAVQLLNSLRPLPVVTKIGLSPKVTKTLKDMNLDIELSSIVMAKISYEYIPSRGKDGKVMSGKYGETLIELTSYVDWSEGIKHNMSRFASSDHCHACGALVESKLFVPIEGFDNKTESLVSMWLGRDCAKNIFGIKDEGLALKERVP